MIVVSYFELSFNLKLQQLWQQILDDRGTGDNRGQTSQGFISGNTLCAWLALCNNNAMWHSWERRASSLHQKTLVRPQIYLPNLPSPMSSFPGALRGARRRSKMRLWCSLTSERGGRWRRFSTAVSLGSNESLLHRSKRTSQVGNRTGRHGTNETEANRARGRISAREATAGDISAAHCPVAAWRPETICWALYFSCVLLSFSLFALLSLDPLWNSANWGHTAWLSEDT